MARVPWSERFYRALLRMFPSEFRGDFAEDMTQVFRDERSDARAQGRLATARLWWRTLRGFISLAPREHLHIFLRDAGYGVRLMRRHALATGAAVLTIALGVGANTAMFSVLKAVLLDLPYNDPARVFVILQQTEKGSSAGVTLAQLEAWKRVDAFEWLAGYWGMSPVLTGVDEARRVRCECVSSSMFAVLGGAGPLMGRTFAEAEDSERGESVIVLSERFWTQVLNRDSSALGRSLTLDGIPSAVVGIMPAAFVGPRGRDVVDAWLPMADCIKRFRAEKRTMAFVNAYGRLKPGASMAVAEAQLSAAMDANDGRTSAQVRVRLHPFTEQLIGEIRTPLLALFGASAFVLLIACANVASLLLGRADARRREVAIRIALGCSRAGIIRQLLTESLVFAIVGGAAGVLVAQWALQLVTPSMPRWIPGIHRIELDGSVLVAWVFISLATGILCGVLPAWSASHVKPGTALKESALGRGPSRGRLRTCLVITEVALSVAVMAGAGLLLKTFLHLRPADPGFDPKRKVMMLITLPRGRYADPEEWRRFMNALQARLATQTDIESVVATSMLALSGNVNQATIQADPGGGRAPMPVDAPIVTAGYLESMRIRVLRGRPVSTRDVRGAPEVALVNETLARRLWAGGDPLGRSVLVELHGRTSTKTIVGLVADVRSDGSRLGARPELYVPFEQNPTSLMRFIVTTPRSADRIARVLKAHVATLDPELPAGDVESLTAIVSRSVATWRFAATLLGAFAALALVLAAVGLFAVVGCWVTERTAEIGVRMALGASPARVVQMFVSRAAWLTSGGLLAGLGLAALTTRFLSEWLVDTTPLDRTAFASAAGVMIAIALAASYLAARRATVIDPLTALRAE